MADMFLDDDFMLRTAAARRLYHESAENMPICDYHCHLSPMEIAEDRTFANLSQAWLAGDHYKWRAMRSNGASERFCTGDASDKEKFDAFAAMLPYALRNPLYTWTHLELRRYFGISGTHLGPQTAGDIYKRCNEMLGSPQFSIRNLLRKMRVAVVCTTDDPLSDLSHHRRIRADKFEIAVLPTFRPDKALAVEDPAGFNAYLDRLGAAADTDIRDFASLIEALDKRHEFFHQAGCRASDHAMERVWAVAFTDAAAREAFTRVRAGNALDAKDTAVFKTAVLAHLARMNKQRGWVMQLHAGTIRNLNTIMFRALGPDTGFDAIGDASYGADLARFLDMLALDDALPKTVLFNINPRDNELLCSIMGCFQDGSVAGKLQHGPAWWFLDQKDGMRRQLEALSNLGLLGRFIGMTTDSRSFLSFPRHELFRRILCDLLGSDMESGELPGDFGLVGGLVRNVCFDNAVDYFGVRAHAGMRAD